MKPIDPKMRALASDIKEWGVELGFQEVAITDVDLGVHADHLQTWLARNFHGEMAYMANNRDLRVHPELLHPGTTRVVCVRMDYSQQRDTPLDFVNDKNTAYVARYARGCDYHQAARKRL